MPVVADLVCECPGALRLQPDLSARSGGGHSRALRRRDVPGNQRGTSRQVGPVVLAEAVQQLPLLPAHDHRKCGAQAHQPRPDGRAGIDQSSARPGNSLSRLHRIAAQPVNGRPRNKYPGVSPDSSSHPWGAAALWAANAHAISAAPAATATSPAWRAAGFDLPGRPARPPSRDNWYGTAACNAAAPSAQPRTPVALGMRFTYLSIVRSGPVSAPWPPGPFEEAAGPSLAVNWKRPHIGRIQRQPAEAATHGRAQINPFGMASMVVSTACRSLPNGGDARAWCW